MAENNSSLTRLERIQQKSAIIYSKLDFQKLEGVTDKQFIYDLAEVLPNIDKIQAIIKQNMTYDFQENHPPFAKVFYQDRFQYLEILEEIIDKTTIYYCVGHWAFRVVDVPTFATSISTLLNSTDLTIFNANQLIDTYLDEDDMIQIRVTYFE